MMTEFSDSQRAALKALCDTYVPSLDYPDDPTGFWARKASDMSIERAVEAVLIERVPEESLTALLGLFDGLAAMGFPDMPQEVREETLQQLLAGFEGAAAGLDPLRKLTLLLAYNLPDASGQNPNWRHIGYPGPRLALPDAPKPIQPLTPTGDELTLEADVCVVGSGSGGGVIAGTLAMQGRKVVVLEAGGYYNEADFCQLESWAYQNLYYRHGPTDTADGNITLLAGATLGGGTVINWMNCVRTPDFVRRQWAQEFGLEGLDTPEFDRHLDTVLRRLNANSQTSDYNAPNSRILEGCAQLGYRTSKLFVNSDPAKYDFELAGYTGFGDPTGSKQSGPNTFLRDAYQHDAQFVVHCRADKILVENGRAVGVIGTYADATGRRAKVTVRAPQVVVACGALESPALLLRSGIGGPAVGNYLRLHPAGGLVGVYEEPQPGWLGWPQTAYCNEFANLENGYGFLIETAAWAPGLAAAATPWRSGRQHKELMAKAGHASTIILIVRDRGHGAVTLDADGNAVHTYPLSDELDIRHFRHGLAEIARIHAAAGANEIFTYCTHQPWKRGDDLEAFIQAITSTKLTDGPVFSAHQMGSCRMGKDPNTSVADTWGQLHDTRGVWIGDTSAFPTPSGANPMITTMALAHRTAEALAAALA